MNMIISNFNNLVYLKNNKQQNSPSFKGSSNFIQIGNSYLKNFDQEISPDIVSKLDKSTKVLLNKVRQGLPKEIPDVDSYKKYLSEIGINSNVLEKNKDRKYILFDYEYSGHSLQNTDEFLRKNIFKSNPKNLIKTSINEVLGREFYNNFHLLFSLSRFKEFSSVGKLNIMDLKNCFKQSNQFTAIEYQSNMAKYLRNIFLYNVFECIEKEKYINSCKKELKALDRHYLSEKAMNIRLENTFKNFEKII